MNRIVLLWICCLGFCFGGFAQGIEFQTGSFEEIMKIAKEQKKWVFIDVYGPICPPCRQMEKEVFPVPEVGEFYNSHFLCMKVNGQTEEKELVATYRVRMWPTYLFFDYEGNLRYQSKGSMSAEAFIAEGKKAFTADSELKEYSYWLKQYIVEGGSALFLSDFSGAMMKRGISLAEAFGRYWVARQKALLSPGKAGQWLDECSTSMLNVNDFMAENLPQFSEMQRLFGPSDPVNSKAYPMLALGDTLVKKILILMQGQNVIQIKNHALLSKNRELMDYALALWDKLPEKNRIGEREVFELEFLLAIDDTKKYVSQATRFLDRLMKNVSRESLLELGKRETGQMAAWGIKEEWKERFEEMYCDLYFNYVETIVRQCMALCKNKKQLPNIMRWAEYGEQLKPGTTSAKQFSSDVRNWK